MPECSKCGRCCRVIVVFYQWTEELEEFFQARGLKYSSDRQTLVVEIPHTCDMLRGNRCSIHNGAKPAICLRFPAGYTYKLPGCTLAITDSQRSGVKT